MTDKEVLKLADEKLKGVGFSGYSFLTGLLSYNLFEKKIRELQEELEIVRGDGGRVEAREKNLAKYLAVKQFCDDNDFIGAAKRRRKKIIIISTILAIILGSVFGLWLYDALEAYEEAGPHGVIVTW